MEEEGQLEPWHLWGNSATMLVQSNVTISQQLVRVNYHRPESWRFMYSISLPSGIAVAQQVGISIKGILGIGRSSIQGGNVATQLAFESLNGTSLLAGTTVIRTRMYPNTWTGTPPTGDTSYPIDVLVAQDLQIWAEVSGNAAAANLPVAVTFQVAPNAHIRPEWFAKKFQGIGGS